MNDGCKRKAARAFKSKGLDGLQTCKNERTFGIHDQKYFSQKQRAIHIDAGIDLRRFRHYAGAVFYGGRCCGADPRAAKDVRDVGISFRRTEKRRASYNAGDAAQRLNHTAHMQKPQGVCPAVFATKYKEEMRKMQYI